MKFFQKIKSAFIQKRRKLPALSNAYDKKFYVENKASVGGALCRSGYILQHRPYFSMRNSTHDAITFNPHRKIATDAAPVSKKPMTSEEFFAFFDRAEKEGETGAEPTEN